MGAKDLYLKTALGTVFGVYQGHDSTVLIVFLHGAGDSHLNYLQFLNYPLLSAYDVFIPDIMGYGKSQRAINFFSFTNQVEILEQQITQLPKSYTHIILVPHSMAGIHAVLLAQGRLKSLVKGIYAIETTVTQYGSFISDEITKKIQLHQDLSQWFSEFCEKVYQQGNNISALRTYYAGLQLTTLQCFTQNCIDMRKLATSETQSAFTNQIGFAFVKLDIPKVYCIAKDGRQLKSLPFLKTHRIPIHTLPTTSHFCAQVCPKQFITKLHQWIKCVFVNTLTD